MDRLYVKWKEGRQAEEARYKLKQHMKAEIISIAEYLNTKYKEKHFVNTVKCQEISQPTVN